MSLSNRIYLWCWLFLIIYWWLYSSLKSIYCKLKIKLSLISYIFKSWLKNNTTLWSSLTNLIGREFHAFINYLLTHGITHKVSCFYALQQNGRVERKHLKVFDCSYFTFLRSYNQHKLRFWSIRCIFPCYSSKHKSYLCLDINLLWTLHFQISYLWWASFTICWLFSFFSIFINIPSFDPR